MSEHYTGATPIADFMLVQTANIASSYVTNHTVATEELPSLIKDIHKALAGLFADEAPEALPSKPAVDIKKSVFPDYIVCLEDGVQMTMLKRHLMTSYGMTPDQYRTKWGLPPNYPMVAPNYAQKRSELAKQSGLGKARTVAPKRNGRPKKVAA